MRVFSSNFQYWKFKQILNVCKVQNSSICWRLLKNFSLFRGHSLFFVRRIFWEYFFHLSRDWGTSDAGKFALRWDNRAKTITFSLYLLISWVWTNPLWRWNCLPFTIFLTGHINMMDRSINASVDVHLTEARRSSDLTNPHPTWQLNNTSSVSTSPWGLFTISTGRLECNHLWSYDVHLIFILTRALVSSSDTRECNLRHESTDITWDGEGERERDHGRDCVGLFGELTDPCAFLWRLKVLIAKSYEMISQLWFSILSIDVNGHFNTKKSSRLVLESCLFYLSSFDNRIEEKKYIQNKKLFSVKCHSLFSGWRVCVVKYHHSTMEHERCHFYGRERRKK